MNKFRFTIKSLAIALFMLAFASMAQAQATRTWVSGVGDDANPCSRTAPCKTFAGAISKTATNGEINALDPAGFGGVTITKAIIIDGGPTNLAGLLVSGTNGIVINAPNDAQVTLRNLDINGINSTTSLIGIKILAAHKVIIDKCLIYGFRATGGTNGRGISDERTNASPVPMLFVNDCDVKNNVGGIAASGVNAGPIRVFINNSRIQGQTSTGVFGAGGARITLRESVVSGNLGNGVQIDATSQAHVISSAIVSNIGIGATAAAGGVFNLADTTIIDNGTGVSGTMVSFGNNNVRNNGAGNTLPAPVGQQ